MVHGAALCACECVYVCVCVRFRLSGYTCWHKCLHRSGVSWGSWGAFWKPPSGFGASWGPLRASLVSLASWVPSGLGTLVGIPGTFWLVVFCLTCLFWGPECFLGSAAWGLLRAHLGLNGASSGLLGPPGASSRQLHQAQEQAGSLFESPASLAL